MTSMKSAFAKSTLQAFLAGVISWHCFFSLYGVMAVLSHKLLYKLGFFKSLQEFPQEVRLYLWYSIDHTVKLITVMLVLFITGTAIGKNVKNCTNLFSAIAFIGFYITNTAYNFYLFGNVQGLSLKNNIFSDLIFHIMVFCALVGFTQYGSLISIKPNKSLVGTANAAR